MSSVKSQIMSAISSAEDAHMKTVLLLMLMVIDEIGGKIDVILQDEGALRHAVLNGHSDQHEAHHDWITVQITKEAEDNKSKRKIGEGIIEKVLYSAIVFAGGLMASKLFGG